MWRNVMFTSVGLIGLVGFIWNDVSSRQAAAQSELDTVAALDLPVRVPFRADLEDGRTVTGTSTPLTLACLSAFQRRHPTSPMTSSALYQVPPGPDVLGSGEAVNVRSITLDPAVNARLKTLPEHFGEKNTCDWRWDTGSRLILNVP